MTFKLNKKLSLYVLLLIVLLVLGGLGVYSALKSGPAKKINQPSDSQAMAQAGEKKLINREGEEWGPLPSGDYKFMVSSGKDTIVKFIQGEINPPDVHVGDLQKFRIVVSSPNGIASVIAKIETDNGIKEVELKKTGSLAQTDLNVNPIYTKDGIHYDIMNETQFAAIVNLQKENHSINTANASGNDNEVFEGSWTVVDTHNIVYHTTFIATDKAGKTNQLVLAWSDLCGFDNGGKDFTLAMNCTISGTQKDGVDGGNLIIGSNYTLQLINGGTLAFNPGKSFSFGTNGKITIPSGTPLGQITKKYIYIEDNDKDGFPPAAYRLALSDVNTTSYIFSSDSYNAKRRYTVSSTTPVDCYDNNANAKPGQTAYFGTNRGDGSFDYDCDNTVTRDPSLKIDDKFGTHPNNGGYTSACNDVEGGYCDGFPYHVWWGYATSNCGETVYYENICSDTYGCQGPNDYIRDYKQPPLRCR